MPRWEVVDPYDRAFLYKKQHHVNNRIALLHRASDLEHLLGVEYHILSIVRVHFKVVENSKQHWVLAA